MIKEPNIIYWFTSKTSNVFWVPKKTSPFIKALVKIRNFNGLKIGLSWMKLLYVGKLIAGLRELLASSICVSNQDKSQDFFFTSRDVTALDKQGQTPMCHEGTIRKQSFQLGYHTHLCSCLTQPSN